MFLILAIILLAMFFVIAAMMMININIVVVILSVLCVCACARTCVWVFTLIMTHVCCSGQRTASMSQFFPSIMWVPDTSSGLPSCRKTPLSIGLSCWAHLWSFLVCFNFYKFIRSILELILFEICFKCSSIKSVVYYRSSFIF